MLDTARALQFQRAHALVVHRKAKAVIHEFIRLIRKYHNCVQIGRTHGQHALPITVGFWLATILRRIVRNARQADAAAAGLVGKISGAVGACNAQLIFGFGLRNGKTFEEQVLAKLGLKPELISTQIVLPEPLANYLFSCVLFSASLGQFGTDCRQLMRTEISEIGEPLGEDQVGSSTMAHKHNPINSENLVGTWLKTKNELGKVLDILVSEHQRDLVGSSLARDFATIVVNVTYQLGRLLAEDKKGATYLSQLSVNENACNRNLAMSENVVSAEPLYIGLQMHGYPGDAHKLVNKELVPLSRRQNLPLFEVATEFSDPKLKLALSQFTEQELGAIKYPHGYVGNASAQALAVIADAEDYLVATH